MSAQLDADVRIVMTAEDRASSEVKDATQRINSEFRGLQQQQRAVGRGFALQHRTLFEAGQALRTVGSLAHTATSIYQRYNIMQLRVEEGARDLAKAQEKVRETLQRYGAASSEYRRALEDEADALRKTKQLQQENIINNIGLATSALTAIGPVSKLANMLRSNPALAGVAAGGVAGAAGGAVLLSDIQLRKNIAENPEQYTPEKLRGLPGGQRSRIRAIQQLPQRQEPKNVTINVNSNDAGLSAQEVYNALDVYG